MKNKIEETKAEKAKTDRIIKLVLKIIEQKLKRGKGNE